MKLKAIAATVALAAVSASANAAWEHGGGPSSTSGELILSVWNAATETSMAVDLGVTTTGAMDLAIGTTFALDQAALDHIGASTAATSDLYFNIAGANYDLNGFVANPELFSFYSTQVAQPNPSFTYVSLANMTGALDNYALQLGGRQTSNGLDNPTFLGTGGANYSGSEAFWGSGMAGLTNDTFGAGVLESAANVGESLYAYSFQFANVGQQDLTPYALQTAGYWVLDIDTATLSYVPVPAAVWLFASGVLGLAGVARRRRKA
ncbi:VPLPA-CTERM sorting domain-containing protein [Ketobacter sp.]|uniref:VPLPA-CTERM sorting domain-containing protein n=1 Tax=Ketobacter sp. TaxID=2083498 RepID=UPI0025C2A2BB|nr:VPLPA-CTERM sorting domain-containing protein [Ketobacter sp.]